MGNENGRKATTPLPPPLPPNKKEEEFLKAMEEINYNKKGIFVCTKLTQYQNSLKA